MPASICDPVSSALRLSLSADDSQSSSLLDSRLYSSAKNVLLSKIEFEESGDYQSNVLDGLKSKYVVIRPKKSIFDPRVLKKEGSASNSSADSTKTVDDGLPRPKRVLFAIERVQVGWQGAWAAGSGMQNVGNTCYLNSTLQALFHVPAFANWLVSENSHVEKCNQQESCVICGMRTALMATQKSGGAPIKPWQVYSKLRLICRHLTPGRQEDAHEFLRYLVEAMEKCYLSRFVYADKLDQYSKETTPLNQILGGYLRSTVRCLACHHLSTTYQHFQDLLLDIRKPSTLDEALDSFFSRERLEDLGYKCEGCNKKVSATKQFFLERPPMVLCIALKRFSLAGGKLSKHIQFRKKICLNKYLYQNKISQQQLNYRLVSLVTHLGPSQNCGHYTAIGQAPNSNYYQFDDSCVRPLPLSAVLGTNAYIMFYERCTEDSYPSSSSTSSMVYGPQLPDNLLNKDKSPMKLTFYRSDDKQDYKKTDRSEAKPPVILNSALGKSSDSNSTKSEPWVVKQNGEIEKVAITSKASNGYKSDDSKKIAFVIRKTPNDQPKVTKLVKSESDSKLHVRKSPEKCLVRSVKSPKSPLEKLEEQMNKNAEKHSSIQKNGDSSSSCKLVPYESDTSADEGGGKGEGAHEGGPTRASQGVVLATKGTHHSWTVCQQRNGPLLSPSLNGDTTCSSHSVLKEKEPASCETSVSSLSPVSGGSGTASTPGTGHDSVRTLPGHDTGRTLPGHDTGRTLHGHDTVRSLHGLSHRGYGAPVDTWAGTHSQLNRQVAEERREERKRALDDVEDMDRGRVKKVKKFHHYNRFHNNRNGYNPFQEKQNKPHWSSGGGFKYRHDRRPRPFHNKHYNKYKRFNNNRYNNGHHYPRHH